MVILSSSFEKDFYSDVQARKRLATSYRNKKNGSKSKKCSLLTDRLTDKQIRERHGEVIVYNLRNPMKWADFKSLPIHAQEEYLLWLKNEFNVTASKVVGMFGIVSSTFSKYISDKELNVKFPMAHRMNNEEKLEWDKFLGITPTSVSETESVQVVDQDTTDTTNFDIRSENISSNNEDKIKTVEYNSGMNVSEITLRFNGDINVNGVINTLRIVLGNCTKGNLYISYNRNGNEDRTITENKHIFESSY